MKLRLFIAVWAATILLSAVPAAAQEETLNRARVAFDEAQVLYEKGQFETAAEKFLEAYKARQFPDFLYDAASAYAAGYQFEKSLETFERYLTDFPKADDRAEVEKHVLALKAEIARRAAAPPTPGGDAGVPEAPEVSPEAKAVSEVGIRGFVVIESKPQGAYIYLDTKKNKPLGRTPWNGTLDGEHTIFLEAEGYKPVEEKITAAKDLLSANFFYLAEEDYLGWIDIRANVPGVDIYLDDKVTVFRKNTYSGNITPGKHKIWVSKKGYDEYFTEIDIIKGKTHEVTANLTGGEVGWINVRLRDVANVRVYVDGEKVCDTACRHFVTAGSHTVSIRRDGFKSYTRSFVVREKTEISIRPTLAPEPSRADAVWAYIFAAAFTGGGIYLGLRANDLEDELRAEIAAGMPPPDRDDSRFLKGKIFAISADAAYAIGGATFLAAIYYTFREKGKPSTATTDVSSIAITPQVAPDYAGVGLEVTW